MKVLVTGGAGYIGSILTPLLAKEGFDVTVYDRFFFGKGGLAGLEDRIKLIRGDIRWIDSSTLRGIDAVIDLAALSNDPIGELDPKLTLQINHQARVRIARLAKRAGAQRYLLASSCSVYGFQKKTATEETPVHPLTTYAKANALWERDALPLASRKFTVTALRQSSVYGLSKRMRFDIAFNNMVLSVFRGKRLPIMRDGKQRRPIIHIRDTSRAFLSVLTADPDLVRGEVFNSGSNDQNFRIYDLAKTAAESVGVPFRFEWYGSPDFRSYDVNFDKIRRVLGFKPKYTPRDGAREVFRALKSGALQADDRTITIRWYQHLQELLETVREVELRGRIL
ncbi:MAG: SDR family oxidoreductase [Thermoplasmata archaeon]